MRFFAFANISIGFMSLENNNDNNNNGQVRNNKRLLALYIFQKITKKHLVATVVYFSRCFVSNSLHNSICTDFQSDISYLLDWNNQFKLQIFLFFLIPPFSQFQSNHILDLSSPEENIWRR